MTEHSHTPKMQNVSHDSAPASMFEHADGEPMLALTEEQCWKLLSRTSHARLGLSFQGEVDIIPVNIKVKDDAAYFRTAPGSKLAELTVNPRVALQADGILSDQAWAVLGHGTAERLETEADIAEAESLGITPWVPTIKDYFVRITLDSVTGRHFLFGTHPERNVDQVD